MPDMLTDRAREKAREWWRRQRLNDGYHATLGHPDGTLYVDTTNRPNYVYAQVQLPTGLTIMEVLCTKVAPQPGLPVIVWKNRQSIWEVVEEDAERAATFWGGAGLSGNVGLHAANHARLARDPLVIDHLQIDNLRVYPTSTPSTTVNVGAGSYRDDSGAWAWFAGSTLDMSSLLPTTTDYYKLVVVGLDRSTGTVSTIAGSEVSVYQPGDRMIPFDGSDIETLLASEGDDFIPLAAVSLYEGMTAIQNYHIFQPVQPTQKATTTTSVADETVTRVLTADFTLTSPRGWVIPGYLEISSGVTLTVESGAEVMIL